MTPSVFFAIHFGAPARAYAQALKAVRYAVAIEPPSSASREGEEGLRALSVRERLRAATNDIHEALHHAAPFAAIADGTATHAGYIGTLSFLHRYHTAMAPLCARASEALKEPSLGAAHAARLAALAADLAHFGVAAENLSADIPDHNEDFCIGALYTVQGSSLGGKLIYRQLDALLPGDKGRTFFKGTPNDSRDWRLLCEGLESRGDRLDALTAGAHHAFAQFQAMLD